MATHTFQIVVTQSGAQATAQAIGQVGAAAQKSASALAFFRQALVVASTIRAASGLVDLIDAATRIDNRLRVATNSAQEFARAQQFVAQISRQTRTDLESNAVTYGRLLKSTESLGLSSDYLEKIMTGLSLSVKVGGATSMEARNAMIQFSQSLASGALRGDELRSVSEQLPALATAIGREFGVSGGQLIAFAKANPGILETERVIKAVAAAVPELTEQAKKMTPTITEGFIAIHNAAVTMLGDINRGTGAFGVFSRALVLAADNLNVVIEIVVALLALRFASTFAAWGGATVTFARDLGAMFSLMRQGNGIMASFSALFAINPITIWIGAIAAAVIALTALYNYFPQVKAAVDGFFGTLGTLVDVLYKIVAAIGQSLPSWVTMDGTMKVVANTVALLIQAFANIITFALVPFALAAEVVVRALNALGIASNESVAAIASARGELFAYAQGLLQGKTASVETGAATEQLTERTKGLLGGLIGAAGGANSAKAATKALADEVKHLDENSALFVSGKFVNDGTWMQGSIEGFTNLARVTKDWEKYTTDAGTAVTQTATAAQTAKPSTDSLAGSMKGVNTQASGAASAAARMSSSLASSAESSTTATKQTKELADLMAKLNPLMVAAHDAGLQAAAGFEAAGNAAQGAVAGVNALTNAYRQLAAAKAAAGAGGGDSSGGAEARAAGGPVMSGNTYLVGEKGPELFSPNVNGNIIPNHALQNAGTTAANDNTVLMVKAINRMANAVVASNRTAAESNQKVIQEIQVQQEDTAKVLRRSAVALSESKSFSGSGYSLNSKYIDEAHGSWGDNRYSSNPADFGYGYFVNAGQDSKGVTQYATQGDYSNWMKENKVLKGDEAYRANIQSAHESGINYYMGYGYDANDPYSAKINQAQGKLSMLKAALERYGIDAFAYSNIDIMGEIKMYEDLIKTLETKSKTATEALKMYREAAANFEQFQKALPGMAQTDTGVHDFQTLTPMQGGKDYGTHDPYGLASAPRPTEEAKQAVAVQQPVGAQDNRVQVQMTVNTPNAESFRQNKAQIESQLASMVDRANRRAGRR